MGIADRLREVKAAIANAAVTAGRESHEVQLIAVSKTRPVADILEAIAAGQMDFGENRVQELAEKHAAIPNARWHLIGTLQRNKVRQIAPFVHLIHSIDNERLLEEVNRQAHLHERIIDCLLQINISDEDQKSGMTEAEAEKILQSIDSYPNIRIQGLMGMAEFTDDMTIVRSQFRRLAAAREKLRAFKGDQVHLQHLSMGMSGDFEVAIAEGATMVRVGSSIFGSR
jgi:PLP dependent protein